MPPAASPSPLRDQYQHYIPRFILRSFQDAQIRQSIASGAIELKSDYDRAYRVYHAATDDVDKYCKTSAEIHAMTARAMIKMKTLLSTPPHNNRSAQDRQSPGRVKGTDVVSQIKYDAATIGLTHWLAENRATFLKELIPRSLEILC
ncbi:hypothetical protein D9619_012327 [Psilocybe cf. subviscida]|uniref:Uncharacterized protein n=1 Tax=Psilocybe cf. subviscida TaxID=2480587 RepID=A0A8H5ER76_9AGAR|nr:hypothetical protein D9619_012327 [Psilocybe cf. subviscida]